MPEEKKKPAKYFELRLPRLNFKDTPINAYLVYTLVIFAFLLGMLTNKVMYLEKVANTPVPTPAAQAQPAPAAAPSASPEQIQALFTDKNIVMGNKNSKNLVVEFADPSCPYCHVAGGNNPELSAQFGEQFKSESEGGTYVAAAPKIKELVDQGKAAFVWIYFPGHGNGEMGTKAFYCAYEQGKFWEVHDKLMNNTGYELLNNQVLNDKTKSQQLVDYLSDVADAGKLKSCIDSGKYDAKLTEDTNIAKSFAISGTPGFFVNTTYFEGAYSWKDMQSAIK
jgi:protein-disulfide isomerase